MCKMLLDIFHLPYHKKNYIPIHCRSNGNDLGRKRKKLSCRWGTAPCPVSVENYIVHTGLLYTLCPRKNGHPKHVWKSSKSASFAQLQFNSVNICLFSIELPILVKICPTGIEILTFNKRLKRYRFQKRAFFLTVHEVNWRQYRHHCRIGKTKTNKIVFSTEDLVLIEVLRQYF